MALDSEFEISDDIGEKPIRVDGFAERTILANYAREAKSKELNEKMEQYHKRQANLHLLFIFLVFVGTYLLYRNGYWQVVKDFFVSMSQTTQ